MKAPILVLFVALLLIIIFVEGVMIIDQELRIKRTRAAVREITGKTEVLLDRASAFISMQERRATSTLISTSTEQYDENN